MDKRFSRMTESGTRLTFVVMLLFVAFTWIKVHWIAGLCELLLVGLVYLYYHRRSKRRAAEIRKYVEKSTDEDANDGLAPDTRTSENHYRVAFAVKGSRRPLVLETVSGEWEKLPEAGEGLLEYSGGLLVAFKPEAK